MNKRGMARLLAITILAAALGGCGEQKADSASDKTSAQQGSAAAKIHIEEKNAVAASQIQSEISKEIQLEETVEKEEAEMTEVSYNRVSVHDPSVAYDNGTYYIFGSHMAWAKSTDLRNWESFQMNINAEYADLFKGEWEEYCKTTTNPNLNGNLWAPDVKSQYEQILFLYECEWK